jgi:glycosyltransferase involved in cell wall biosynthesis
MPELSILSENLIPAQPSGSTIRKLRIVHVVPTYLPAVRYGGPIFAIHALCSALAARGHDIEVFTTNINGAGISEVPVGVPVWLDGVKIRYFSSDVLRRLSWAPSLSRALKSEVSDFDVVHIHSVFLWPTWAAAHLAKRANVPYLISPRGMLVRELVQRKSRLVKAAWMTLIERSNLERASTIHVTSEVEEQELKRFKWQLPRIVMIPNGVEDLESSHGAEPSSDVLEIVSHQPLVLFLGRISWKKGLDRLLRAFARTCDGILAVVGPDDEGLVPGLRRLAGELGISDRVRFLARTVLGNDKDRLFRAARLFVLPSYSENFGNTVLEAMQRGVPVVVTPEVGAASIVREARGGIVVDGDPGPLSAAMNSLLDDADGAQNMGGAGQRHVRERYAWSRVAAQMEALYGSLAVRAKNLHDA